MAGPFIGQQLGSGVIQNLTAAQWADQNYVLNIGVTGIESDTGKVKRGDGATAWNSLGYSSGGQVGATLVTSPVATAVVTEFGDSKDITSIITLTNFIVGAIPAAAAALSVGNIVAAFPAGQHFELVYAMSNIVLTLPGTPVPDGTLSLGSVIGAGASATMTTTEVDRMAAQAATTAAGGGTAINALVAATAGIGTGISLNVAASVKNVFLNAAGTWAVNNAGNLTATGAIVLKWTKMQ